jgi:glutaconate CoA-transferase, subunit B
MCIGQEYTSTEMMTIAASRYIKNNIVLFVGIGLPSVASNLARVTHAPDTTLIYESGTIGAKPNVLPLSIGDEDLAETADAIVSVPDIFRYWLQGGRVDLGFLGAAQVDRFGNINSTVIGDYNSPKTRLPGAGGAPEIATLTKEYCIIMRHSKRGFVKSLPFVTSPGYISKTKYRDKLGLGAKAIITDLGILTREGDGNEFILTAIYDGVSIDTVLQSTGWDLLVSDNLKVEERPSEIELVELRKLHAKTNSIKMRIKHAEVVL